VFRTAMPRGWMRRVVTQQSVMLRLEWLAVPVGGVVRCPGRIFVIGHSIGEIRRCACGRVCLSLADCCVGGGAVRLMGQ